MSEGKKKMKDYRQAKLVRLDIIATLYKRGYSYREIRDEVMARLDLSTYSLRTVSKDVHTLLEEWKESRINNFDLSVQLELERIDTLIKEAWEAWDKSKEDYVQKSSKQKGVPSNSEVDKEIITLELEQSSKEFVQNGDPRFLEVINKLLIERRKILGLYAPDKREITGKNGKDLIHEPIIVKIIDSADQLTENEE